MVVRVGTVTNIYPAEGMVRVLYQDREETSVKLPLLASEYKLPEIGDAVVTLHMEGRSSGFVLVNTITKIILHRIQGIPL